MPSDPIFWLVAALAVFIVALSKSGLAGALGAVGVPLLTLVTAPREAAGILLPVMLLMDAFAVYAYRKDLDWRNFRIIVPGAIAGIAIGWIVSSVVSDDAVILVVGIIALIFILDALLPLRKKVAGKPPSTPWGVFWGGVTGFTSFISHSGGLPFQMYVLPQKLPPPVFAATSAWTFATINAIKLVPYFFLGQLSVSNLEISLVLAPVAIAGVLLGIYLVRIIVPEVFYKIAYVLVFLLSLKLIWDGVTGVFGL